MEEKKYYRSIEGFELIKQMLEKGKTWRTIVNYLNNNNFCGAHGSKITDCSSRKFYYLVSNNKIILTNETPIIKTPKRQYVRSGTYSKQNNMQEAITTIIQLNVSNDIKTKMLSAFF